MPLDQSKPNTSNKFGTFAGVFTPSVLTILGVILFIRAGFVVGQAGVFGALLILLIAKSITSLTALSISAISTNMEVRGGGAYFLISRVLGPEFGGAIGMALFFAQALSVPFYILGFAEALMGSFPVLEPYFLWVTLSSAAILFVVAYVGADSAIKAQYGILAMLVFALLVSFTGMVLDFSPATLKTNWGAGYTLQDLTQPGLGKYSFWMIFAIYFPAVTGILAGVNMSGDLKDPARSIPRGTIYALGVTFVVYFILIVLSGGAFDRADLISNPYQAMKDHALFGLGFAVAGGVFAASLSSALGSYLGAPRILQAVARDRILSFIRPFAQGSVQGDEPRLALVLTGLITLIVLLWSGNSSGGDSLNVVASVITMFFLYTYGMINLAAFIEAFGRNPSFRPRFRFFHWSTALLAALACLGVALLIDFGAAIVAALILAALLWYIQRRDLKSTFGDARRGFVYTNVRNNLLRLANMEEDDKNWRPTILVFTGNPHSREALITYAVWMEAGRGIVLMANILPSGDSIEQDVRRRQMAENQFKEFCRSQQIQAFPVIAIGDNKESTTAHLIQSTSIGPIRPNICMFGWSREFQSAQSLLKLLRIGSANGVSLVMVASPPDGQWTLRPTQHQKLYIDVWWRGKANGRLMIILAHLMTRNWEWGNTELRVFRVVEDEAGLEPATASLTQLIDEARVDARVVTILREERSFRDILYQQSSWSECVFMGFDLPPTESEQPWFENYESLLKGMPPTVLVHALSEQDVLT